LGDEPEEELQEGSSFFDFRRNRMKKILKEKTYIKKAQT
jgi:hypothetical protein